MSLARGAITTFGLLLIFLLQEAGISKIHLPFSGFSLYLTVLLALITFEDGNAALVTGFIGGLILDLSPSTISPFGQWALILTGVAYLLSSNKDLLGTFESRPGNSVLVLALSVVSVLTLYILTSVIFGEVVGSFAFIVKTIVASGIWSALIAPFVLPLTNRVRKLTLKVENK